MKALLEVSVVAVSHQVIFKYSLSNCHGFILKKYIFLYFVQLYNTFFFLILILVIQVYNKAKCKMQSIWKHFMWKHSKLYINVSQARNSCKEEHTSPTLLPSTVNNHYICCIFLVCLSSEGCGSAVESIHILEMHPCPCVSSCRYLR